MQHSHPIRLVDAQRMEVSVCVCVLCVSMFWMAIEAEKLAAKLMQEMFNEIHHATVYFSWIQWIDKCVQRALCVRNKYHLTLSLSLSLARICTVCALHKVSPVQHIELIAHSEWNLPFSFPFSIFWRHKTFFVFAFICPSIVRTIKRVCVSVSVSVRANKLYQRDRC